MCRIEAGGLRMSGITSGRAPVRLASA